MLHTVCHIIKKSIPRWYWNMVVKEFITRIPNNFPPSPLLSDTLCTFQGL